MAADEGNGNLNQNLTYYKENVDHYGNTVGQIRVPLGQSNFFSNGRYQIRVTSNGKGYLFPIHVVNETAPTLKINEMNLEPGKDIHFKVENMTYGITVPIYKVELTDPDGKTSELTKIDDWYLFGDTFVLYNDNNNHTEKAGKYKLTIYADGFKSCSKEFMVGSAAEQSAEVATAADYGIDVLSSASVSGGGSTSGSGSDGGSTTMSADLIFDADLLANAKIVEKLGYKQEAATAISERWDSMSGYDSVFSTGGTYYTCTSYFDAVNTARMNGQCLSFADFVNSESAEENPNHPYAYKYVLEDNLLGETQMNSDPTNQAAPRFYMMDKDGNILDGYSVEEGKDLVLYCDDVVYMEKLTEIYVDGNGQALAEDKYEINPGSVDSKKGTVTPGTLTIKAEALKLGKVSLKIKADTYQDNLLNINCDKVLEKFTVTVAPDAPKAGEDAVTLTCKGEDGAEVTGDCWKYIQKVTLTLPDGTTKELRPDGQDSVFEKIGYTIEDASLTLGKDLFKDGGEYKVEVNFEYYDAVNVTFTVTKEEVPEQQGKDAPEATGVVTKTNYAGKTYYGVVFEKAEVSDVDVYLKTLRSAGLKAEVTVDGTNITFYSLPSFIAEQSLKWAVETDSSYGNCTYLDFTNDCFPTGKEAEVVVKVEGYKDLTFYVKDGKIVSADDSDNGETEVKEAPVFTANAPKADEAIVLTTDSNDAAEYLAKVSGVSYKAKDSDDSTAITLKQDQYTIDKDATTITINEGVLGEGTYIVTITAEGYEDATVDVTVAKKDEFGSDNGGEEETGLDAPTVASFEKIEDKMWGDIYYRVTFNAIENLDQYLSKYIKEISFNELTFEKKYSLSSGKVWKTSIGSSGTEYIDFSEECFKDTSTGTIVIKAEGYKTLTFKIEDGVLVEDGNNSGSDNGEEEDGADAPTVVAVEKPRMSNYYKVSFKESEDVVDAFLSNIPDNGGVVVDGKEWTKTSFSWDFSDTSTVWKTSKIESGASEKLIYLFLSTGKFAESTPVEVTIKSNGYKTLTFKIANGQLVTADTQSAEDSKDESENEVQVQPEEVVVPAAEEQAAVMEEPAQETESQAAVVEESAQDTETKAVVEAAPAEETVSTEEQAPAEEASEEAEISEENVEDSSDNVDAQEETAETNE